MSMVKDPDMESQGVDKYFKRYIMLNILRQLLSTVRVPLAKHNIHKEEGMYTFDSPDTETGLYVSLTSFIGFGEEFVYEYMNRSGNRVFLHIQREKIPNPQMLAFPEYKSRIPMHQILKMALEVENGQPIKRNYEFKTVYNIMILPDKNVKLAYPDCELQHIVAESVEEILRREAVTTKIMQSNLKGHWPTVVEPTITRYSENLFQFEKPEEVKPTDLKCATCGTAFNLWMNLTNGAIHCSRVPQADTEHLEKDHSYQHFRANGYPLIIRLDTINTNLSPVVYSFPESSLVKDANLRMHIRRFGIALVPSRRGPRSVEQQHMEINDRFGEWYVMTEMDNDRQEIMSGPGLTGMRNMGSTCYLNATMQLIFVIKDFLKRFSGAGATLIFRKYVADPMYDFNLQMAKMGQGLTSGKYCESGITPSIFKHLVCDDHPVLRNPMQQDAFIFYQVLVDLISKAFRSTVINPVSALRICFEDCYWTEEADYADDNKDQVHKNYEHYDEYCIRLPIPVTKVTNCHEEIPILVDTNKDDSRDPRHSIRNVIRQKIPFEDCVEAFFKTQLVEKYHFDDTDIPTTALKTRRICNMPDYVMIQLCKFVTHDDWTPNKLDVSIDMPWTLDLSEWRSSSGYNVTEEASFTYNEALLNKLHLLGFPKEAAKRACFYTLNFGMEAACTWLKMHENDKDLDTPFELPINVDALQLHQENDPEILGVLLRMGFNRYYAQLAIFETDGSIEETTKWLLSHSQTMNRPSNPETANEVDSLRSSNAGKYRDGAGTYELTGFISHMGSSSQVGHYVCHVRKNNEWVLFDDLRVVKSINPPKNFGYLYLYVRSQ